VYRDVGGEPLFRRALRDIDVEAVDMSRWWKISGKVDEPNATR